MACDASHHQNHISLNLNNLRNAVDLDPVEFVAEEDFNRPEKGSKGSEGAQEKIKKNRSTESAHLPYLQLPTSPIMSS